MSVNRYNPYHTNSTATRGGTEPYPAQSTSSASATQRNYEPAVWQWVPDALQNLQGPYRVLMSGLPTENVAKKEIIELFSGHVTPNVVVDPIYDEIGFNGSCIFTLYTTEDVLKTYEQFEGKYFDDMSTQIKVEYLIRPGSRVPVKIARQIIHDDQIVAVTPIHPPSQPVTPAAYYPNGQTPAGPSNNTLQANIPTGPTRNAPRGPAQSKANGTFANSSASTSAKSRQTQLQNAQGSKPHASNNNSNHNKNAGAATSGKSLLQRMNIGLEERISRVPPSKGSPPTEPVSSKKLKNSNASGPGPARPNASFVNQARRNLKPYAPPPTASTHSKAQQNKANQSQQKQQPQRKETQQEILDQELENFQKRRGK